MRSLRVVFTLSMAVVMALALSLTASAKSEPMDSYRLCLEAGVGEVGVPATRFNLLVDDMNRLGGTITVADPGDKTSTTYIVTGGNDPAKGAMTITGRGYNYENMEYKGSFTVMIPKDSKEGTFTYSYGKIDGKEMKQAKGKVKIVPCVKHGARN